MKIDEIKQAIQEQEASIGVQLQEFQALRTHIVEEIKPFAKARMKEDVELKVKSEPNHTKELGIDALTAMKQHLLSLLDRSDEVVDSVFSDDSLWIHTNYRFDLQDPYSYKQQGKAKTQIMTGIRRILGEAGQILLDNKYIQVGQEYVWETQYLYGYSGVLKGKLVYRYGVGVPQNISTLIDEYSQKIGALHELYKKLYYLQKSLSEQEAADLWENL